MNSKSIPLKRARYKEIEKKGDSSLARSHGSSIYSEGSRIRVPALRGGGERGWRRCRRDSRLYLRKKKGYTRIPQREGKKERGIRDRETQHLRGGETVSFSLGRLPSRKNFQQGAPQRRTTNSLFTNGNASSAFEVQKKLPCRYMYKKKEEGRDYILRLRRSVDLVPSPLEEKGDGGRKRQSVISARRGRGGKEKDSIRAPGKNFNKSFDKRKKGILRNITAQVRERGKGGGKEKGIVSTSSVKKSQCISLQG